MRRSRWRTAGLVTVLATLASGCALIVDGLSTDFSTAGDGAAPAADAALQDATMTTADAADVDSSAPPLPAPTPFAAFPLSPLSCTPATANGWHLDCSFGAGGSVVVDNPSGTVAPVLTEGAGAAAVFVAVARDAGTFIEGIDGDGGRTVFAVTDAGVPIDLTTTALVTYANVISMLSNRPGDGTSGRMTPVISSKLLQGMSVDSTNDIGVAVVATLDASLVAVRPLAVTAGNNSTAMTYYVNYLDGGVQFGPGIGTAEATPSGIEAYAQPLNLFGPDGNALDIGPIVTGVDYLKTLTYVVGYGSDGRSTSYATSDKAVAPATAQPLPYVVDDSVVVARVGSDGGNFTYPLVAGHVDGGARVDWLDPSIDASSPPNFPFDDPGVGALRLRAVPVDGGDELLVAGASTTGMLYLALYSINVSSFGLSGDPTFGDAGFLVVPLQFPAQLGAAVWNQGACYVSLLLTGADAGTSAVVIRIVAGSP